MSSSGTITLADIAVRTDTLAIAYTSVTGPDSIRWPRWIRRYAPELSIPDLLRILSAGCPMRELVSPDASCGAYCPELCRGITVAMDWTELGQDGQATLML